MAIRHSLTSDEHNAWVDLDCDARVAGVLCQKESGLPTDGLTGTFKLFIGSTPQPEAMDPPVWPTVLYYRAGGNLTDLGVYAKTFLSRGNDCVDEYDLQHGTASTYYDEESDQLVMSNSAGSGGEGQCAQLVKAGFDCVSFFCEECEYPNFCDAYCGFCGTLETPPPPPGSNAPPPAPPSDDDGPVCLDAYDAQGSASQFTTTDAHNAAAGNGQCAMLIAAGFDCYTWMCADCSYASFCDRTCGFEACDCEGDGVVDEEYCAHMAAIAAGSGR